VFVFAHFSDLHLAPFPRPRVGQLLNKRALSYLSFLRKRGSRHQAKILDRALVAMHEYGPEHLCVTGDLVNLALPREIEQAAAWLRELGPDLSCTVAPGNHDALVRSARPLVAKLWAPWMADEFPSVVRKGDVAFIGLSSAVPTPLGFASGRVDEAQLRRLERILAETGAEGCFRVLSIHHPPRPESDSWRRNLRNGGALCRVLHAHGAELILHGHTQKPIREEIPGPSGRIPVFGAGSASLTEEKANSGHFHGFRLESKASGFTLRADHFRYRAEPDAFAIEFSETVDYPTETR